MGLSVGGGGMNGFLALFVRFPFVPCAFAPHDHKLPLWTAGLPLGMAWNVRPWFGPGSPPHPADTECKRPLCTGGRLHPGPVQRSVRLSLSGKPDAQPVRLYRLWDLLYVPSGLFQLYLPGLFCRKPLRHHHHPHRLHAALRHTPALQPYG